MTESTGKKPAAVDVLHFNWTCRSCQWTGEMTVATHFGNDRGRHLSIGDCLFDCHKQIEPRHVFFLEKFRCPGCSTEDESFYHVAEIHCVGNKWFAVQTYPACELDAAEPRI